MQGHYGNKRSKSPPSFCNGLGTIYIYIYIYSVLSRKDLWSYYQSMGLEFRYTLGKVLGTQGCPTLRLASHHCVLCLDLIKNMFNTYFLTHTHTSMHLTYDHGIIIPKQHTYQPKAKESQTQTQIRNPSIHLTYEHPIKHLK